MSKTRVAILIFPGVELLDFTGPAEVFVVAAEGGAFEVCTVAATREPLRTMGGVHVIPDFDYDSAPRAEIVVVPGGDLGQVGEAGRAWVRKAAGEAEIVMSVCMGALLLGRLGLLDGIEATTHSWGIESLKKIAPACRVVHGPRFVDAGRVITSAGVTAGIDAALHVVRRRLGDAAADWTGDAWMEYRAPRG
ncbi:MAG: DJ-1/PfpI family protein [Planctomycetes bacterium]|nr:DJ-1/PfpI family protein [Planctomycetota bacterium]